MELGINNFAEMMNDQMDKLKEIDQKYRDKADAREAEYQHMREQRAAQMAQMTGFSSNYWQTQNERMAGDATGAEGVWTQLNASPKTQMWEQNAGLLLPQMNEYLDHERTANTVTDRGAYNNAITAEMALRGLGEITGFPVRNVGGLEAAVRGVLDNYSANADMIIAAARDGYQGERIQDVKEGDRFTDQATSVLTDLFTPEVIAHWETMTFDQRAEILDVFARHIGGATDINITGIRVADLDGAAGMNNGDGILYLDYRGIEDSEQFSDLLDTVVHEARHQFQREAVANPERFDIPKETLEQWANNFTDYISYKDDPMNYFTQSIEADAYDVAGNAINTFFINLAQQVKGA